MANVAQKIYADFSQGFVTTANPLAYPEGSVKDILNFDIRDNGTLAKRAGLLRQTPEGEEAFPDDTPGYLEKDIKVFLWTNAQNVAGQNYFVVMKNRMVTLYRANDDGIDFSDPVKQVNVYSQSIPNSYFRGEIRFAKHVVANGDVFFAHPETHPMRMYLDEDNELRFDPIRIQIRDTSVWEGNGRVETGYTEKSAVMSPIHEYNLRNGGWPREATVVRAKDSNNTYEDRDPVRYTAEELGYFPDISSSFYVGKNGGGQYIEQQLAYSPWALENNYIGNTTPPVGRFIYNAHDFTRVGTGFSLEQTTVEYEIPDSSEVSGFTYTETVNAFEELPLSVRYRWKSFPTDISFYAGRLWYAGQKGYTQTVTPARPTEAKLSPMEVESVIYFSQQLGSDIDRAAKCYQDNDPTAEDINELLPTDGGFISIRGLGEVNRMVVFNTSLIVFTSEGIWSISGKDLNSFTATDYSVNKISSIKTFSGDTIIEAGNNVLFLAQDAIYSVTLDPVSGVPSVQDISSDRIKGYYQKIPFNKKKEAKIFYDAGAKLVYFMFEKDEEDNVSKYKKFRNILILNEDLGCYYKYELPDFDREEGNRRRIIDAVYYPRDLAINVDTEVFVDDDLVLVGTDTVALSQSYFTESLSTINFIFFDYSNEGLVDPANTMYAATFSDITNFADLGTPFTAYVETGFDSAGDLLKNAKQTPKIISFLEKTEDGFEVNPEDPENIELILKNKSSCLLQHGWDWASRYSRPQQIYKFRRSYVPAGTEDTFDYGVDVISVKTRVRGRGTSLGIKLSSEEGMDCRILGMYLIGIVPEGLA